MIYDAVLAARRGLGVDEHHLVAPEFGEAVHWAVFAEANAERLADLREVVAVDPPEGLRPTELTRFMANRRLAREELRELEARLYPDDEPVS